MYFRGDTIQKPHIYYIIYIYVLYVCSMSVNISAVCCVAVKRTRPLQGTSKDIRRSAQYCIVYCPGYALSNIALL